MNNENIEVEEEGEENEGKEEEIESIQEIYEESENNEIASENSIQFEFLMMFSRKYMEKESDAFKKGWLTPIPMSYSKNLHPSIGIVKYIPKNLTIPMFRIKGNGEYKSNLNNVMDSYVAYFKFCLKFSETSSDKVEFPLFAMSRKILFQICQQQQSSVLKVRARKIYNFQNNMKNLMSVEEKSFRKNQFDLLKNSKFCPITLHSNSKHFPVVYNKQNILDFRFEDTMNKVYFPYNQTQYEQRRALRYLAKFPVGEGNDFILLSASPSGILKTKNSLVPLEYICSMDPISVNNGRFLSGITDGFFYFIRDCLKVHIAKRLGTIVENIVILIEYKRKVGELTIFLKEYKNLEVDDKLLYDALKIYNNQYGEKLGWSGFQRIKLGRFIVHCKNISYEVIREDGKDGKFKDILQENLETGKKTILRLTEIIKNFRKSKDRMWDLTINPKTSQISFRTVQEITNREINSRRKEKKKNRQKIKF